MEPLGTCCRPVQARTTPKESRDENRTDDRLETGDFRPIRIRTEALSGRLEQELSRAAQT